ncbi:RNA-binding protein 27-like [Scleropages formosus]|uniref:RNA-binding protein 27-like n=1 Tax=Scleropages formosus TaxID=113540 RepID=UPI0010FA69F4|nr:RNA-binding protein 27-like [Scleropages formosus]
MLGGNPEAALIEYAANEEAGRAISSTEAVLNNYFIRLRWYQEDSEQLFLLPQQNVPVPCSNSVVEVTSESSGETVKAQKAKKRKQDTLKLHQYRTKKKQEMLEIQIKCQKALINKLQKNKDMTPEERANVMKTFKELMDKISLLKEELKQAAKTNRVF